MMLSIIYVLKWKLVPAGFCGHVLYMAHVKQTKETKELTKQWFPDSLGVKKINWLYHATYQCKRHNSKN